MVDRIPDRIPARLQAARARAAAALAAAALCCLSACTGPPTYVGSSACASCHATQAQAWQTSDHMRAMMLPDSASVLGDFDNASFTHFGDTYRFVEGDSTGQTGKISVIARRGASAQADTLAVEWVFGYDPLQQVLLPGNRGRLQALTVAWDTRPDSAGGGHWYSMYPHEATPPGDMLDWQRDGLSWNYMCASCHTTALDKGYDIETDRYETTWAESTVGCESCHGPGSQHAESPSGGYGMTGAAAADPPVNGRPSMAVLENELTMCAACHSRRTPLVEPTPHGESFLDQFAPALIQDGLYFDDGQILDEVYVYGSFLQSGMAQAGVTCSDCHDPHTGKRKLEGNALCQSCHAGKIEDVAVHVEHGEVSCETCHMPSRTFMGVDARGDHRFGIPDPITSRQIGSPNVCADCHGDDRSVEAILNGPQSRPGLAALALRTGTTDRMGQVQEVLVDSTVSRFEKGSLIARLGSEPSTDGLRIVMTSLQSGDPFERVGALRAIADPAFRAPLPDLTRVFADSLRWVRVEAVATALAHGYTAFDEEPASTALLDYETAQLAVAEQPEAHLNLASMHEIKGEWEHADASYSRALRLAPRRVDILTGHGLMLGRWANRVLESDPARYRALRSRGEATLKEAVDAAGDEAAPPLFVLGLYLGEERPRLPDAAAALEASWRADSSNVQAIYNAAVAWHQMGDLRNAERLYLEGLSVYPEDAGLLDALVTLLMQADRWEEASERNQMLRKLQPGQTRLLERQALIDGQLRSQD